MSLKLRDVLRSADITDKAVVLVTGAWHAGKSTFLASVSERDVMDVEGDDECPYDLGQINIDGKAALFLLESPGARRWDLVMTDTGLDDPFAGVLIVVDSAKSETFREAKAIVETPRMYRLGGSRVLPLVIAANKSDHADAWTPDDLRLAFHTPDAVILPCVATDPDSAKRVLLALLEQIPDNDVVRQATTKLRAKLNGDAQVT